MIYLFSHASFACHTCLCSGNFCGGVTVLLALIKRDHCPDCRLITVDPTLQAQQAQYKQLQCGARHTLDVLGLSSLVEVREHFGQDVPLDGPIGFAYFDDGKIREAMAPQMALVEPYLMDGALLGFDDYAQEHAVKGPASHRKIIDHKELMRELVSSGDYVKISGGELHENFGALQRTRKRGATGHRSHHALGSASPSPWAEMELALVDSASGVRVAQGRLELPEARLTQT